MNYANIKKYDISNGYGIRVSLFVSGCRRHCQGCFNSVAWDFNYGKEFTEDTEKEIFELLNKDYISGFSLLGGEPFEPENQIVLCDLLEKIKINFPDKDIWCYTGYRLDELKDDNNSIKTQYSDKMLKYIDILVDGEFIEEQKNISLSFRGSENQRIIKL